jgi:TonB family protein
VKNNNALLLSLVLITAAQAADPPPAQDNTTEAIDTEVFEGARPLTSPGPSAYPPREEWNGREGWVMLNLMIDALGKPHDATVVDSTGNPAFDEAALKMLDQMTFQPAKSGRTPIDSSLTFKIKFYTGENDSAASPDFVSKFLRFQKAVNAGDRAGADAQLLKVDANNLYEDAFKSYGEFQYHQKWGTPEQQLRDLRHALAGESSGTYLPAGLFSDLLMQRLILQAKSQDYGGALATGKTLARLARPAARSQVQTVIDRILDVQKSDAAVRLSGQIANGPSWNGTLFRKRFSIVVTSGAISEIKLRCKKQYILFKYQPDIQYTVNAGAGDCGIEIIGDPGTAFELTQ